MTGSRGRPLRFAAVVGTLWISARVALIWQETGSLPQALERAVPLPRAIAAASAPVGAARVVMLIPPPARTHVEPAAARPVTVAAMPPHDPVRVQLAMLARTQFGRPIPLSPSPPAGIAVPAPVPVPAPPLSTAGTAASSRRWSVSSWAIVRPGRGLGASPGAAQLGGSQGGTRIDYALGRGIALTGRFATPLSGPGREAGLGVAWQPSGLPIRVIAEQRIALGRGRGGPSLGVAGGVSQVPLPAGFRLEGYAQGGAIARAGVESYMDGLARAAHPVASMGAAVVDLGIGGWGGAQRGTARLDIGPSASVRLPVADGALRLSLDWRHRIAGSARPGSGPALTLGSDF